MTQRTWSFVSATQPDTTYTVTEVRAGMLTCSCPGFKFGHTCRHAKTVQAELPPVETAQFLAAALAYQAMGYTVIPVEPGGKRPLVQWKDWQKAAPSVDQLTLWWKKTPNANVGLVLGGGRFAVDLDGGAEAEALLAAKGIELPADAPRSKTRSGFHVFLSASSPQPDRIGLLQAAEPLAEESLTPKGTARHASIDIRGLGIIIAAPSVHPSGAVYTWLTPLTATPPAAPAALLELIRDGAKQPSLLNLEGSTL